MALAYSIGVGSRRRVLGGDHGGGVIETGAETVGFPAPDTGVEPDSAPRGLKSLAAQDSRSASRVGWEALEALVHPVSEKQAFLHREETWGEAERAFAAACEQGCTIRQRAAAHFSAAEHARLEGNLASASTQFQQAATTDPTWALPLLGLARAELHNDPALARKHATSAYSKDPSLWIALGVRGASFAREGDYVRAIQELLEERRVAPEDCRSQIDAQLALTYQVEGLREGKAVALALSACSGHSRVAPACTVLAERALRNRRPDEALRYAELADRDDFIPLVLVEGDALQMKGQTQRAWLAWKRVVALKGLGRSQGASESRLAAIEAAVKSGRPPPLRDRSVTMVHDADGLAVPSF